MSETDKIYIVGAGAIGMSLAVHLVGRGRKVIAVRTSRHGLPGNSSKVDLQDHEANSMEAVVEMVSLSMLESLQDGIIVITAKANANKGIASQLKEKHATGPIIIMQNGLGVEEPFVDAGFADIYRCVLYATAQKRDENSITFRAVAASPIGTVKGDDQKLSTIVEHLNSSGFQFRVDNGIEEEIWKKAIMNAVFNSICPLLDVDNGIFIRDGKAAETAREIIRETIAVAKRIGLDFKEDALMAQLLMISEKSEGQYISTLQDLKNGKETEIGFLNLQIARIADAMTPKAKVSRTRLLGELIAIKSQIQKNRPPVRDQEIHPPVSE